MNELIMFVVMTSPHPVWYQSEGVACARAIKEKVPIYVIETRGGISREDPPEKAVIVLDEENNGLRPVTCAKIKGKFNGLDIEVYRVVK